MTAHEKAGVELAERLLAWMIHNGSEDMTGKEVREIIERVFGPEIAAMVMERAINAQIGEPIEAK